MSMIPNQQASPPAPAAPAVLPQFDPANVQVMAPAGIPIPAQPAAPAAPPAFQPQQPGLAQAFQQFAPPAPQQPIPAAPPAAAPVAPAQDFRGILRSQGIDTTGLDDGRLAETFVHLMRQNQAAQNAAAQPPLPPQAAQPQAGPPARLKRADVEPFFGLVEKDGETGFVKPKLGVQPEVAQRVNAFLRQQQETERALYEDPAAFIWNAVQKQVQDVARQQAEQAAVYRDQVAETAQFVQQHSHWIYAKGQDGQVQRDFQGKAVLTPQGQQFMQIAAHAEQNGLNPMAQATFALGQLARSGFMPPQQMQQAPPQPVASPDQRLAAFNQQVAGQNRAATNGNVQTYALGDGSAPNMGMTQLFHEKFAGRAAAPVLQ